AGALQIRVDLVRAGHDADQRERRGRGEPLDEIAARFRSVRIGDDDRHMADVRGGRVAEHQELQDRREDDDAEQPRILPQLDQFLPDEKTYPAHVIISYFAPGPHPRRLCLRALVARSALVATTVRLVNGDVGPHPRHVSFRALVARSALFATTIRLVSYHAGRNRREP